MVLSSVCAGQRRFEVWLWVTNLAGLASSYAPSWRQVTPFPEAEAAELPNKRSSKGKHGVISCLFMEKGGMIPVRAGCKRLEA